MVSWCVPCFYGVDPMVDASGSAISSLPDMTVKQHEDDEQIQYEDANLGDWCRISATILGGYALTHHFRS